MQWLVESFGAPLSGEFYARSAAVVAREMLGTLLVRAQGQETTAGLIVETEAYLREGDPACHAYRGATPRNSVMFGPPGRAYVYFTYGNHHLLNAVVNEEGVPEAVLIRAVQPVFGLRTMALRRVHLPIRQWTNGPGKVCQAMGIAAELNNTSLLGDGDLRIVSYLSVPSTEVATASRIGIQLGRDLPLRFYVRSSPFVSRR